LLPREDEVARRWWTLPHGYLLPLNDGGGYTLLFAGYPGNAAGPDVRDVVLRSGSCASNSCGDVEFHVRASDWTLHGHHTDPRYNNVILHIVLLCDVPGGTIRQDGQRVPLCSLHDLPPTDPAQAGRWGRMTWPCQRLLPLLSQEQRHALLRRAGLLRFEQKTYAFVEQLHRAYTSGAFDAYDTCLISALAEGLGYGRDRALFKAVGLRLLGLADQVPEPLGRSPAPAPLDAQRLTILRTLVEGWRKRGLWPALRDVLLSAPSENATDRLHALYPYLGALSRARADILICNVVLPFAAAVALIGHDPCLAACARELYLLHPGLPSNHITRLMSRQLRLGTEPRGSCLQQGLQYIYAQTCREKRCDACMAGRDVL
jgi:hypothetical protein